MLVFIGEYEFIKGDNMSIVGSFFIGILVGFVSLNGAEITPEHRCCLDKGYTPARKVAGVRLAGRRRAAWRVKDQDESPGSSLVCSAAMVGLALAAAVVVVTDEDFIKRDVERLELLWLVRHAAREAQECVSGGDLALRSTEELRELLAYYLADEFEAAWHS